MVAPQVAVLGLEPAGENGGRTQKVPLVRYQMGDTVALKLTAGGRTTAPRQGQEVMLTTQRPVNRVKIDKAPLVFVGYGVSAAEREDLTAVGAR